MQYNQLRCHTAAASSSSRRRSTTLNLRTLVKSSAVAFLSSSTIRTSPISTSTSTSSTHYPNHSCLSFVLGSSYHHPTGAVTGASTIATTFSNSINKYYTSTHTDTLVHGDRDRQLSTNSRIPFSLHSRGGHSQLVSVVNMSTSSSEQTSTTTPSTTTPTTTSTSTQDKLQNLRIKMKQENIHVLMIPTDDPHLSEYVPDAYKRRAYVTGFTGSAGTAVVTLDKAHVWTDSRYFNEANLQLDSDHWELMKQGQPKVPTINKFLSNLAVEHYKETKQPLTVGIDAYVHSASFAKDLMDAFDSASKDEFSATTTITQESDEDTTEEKEDDKPPIIGKINTLNENLVDAIWEDRPPVPTSPFRIHPLQYAGMSVSQKIKAVRTEMTTKKATLAVFSALDDIAYFLNLRCKGDIDTCPVGIAYLTVTQEDIVFNDDVVLFCHDAKLVSQDVQQQLEEAGVLIQPYENIVPAIDTHVKHAHNGKVWIDKSRSNYAISRLIPDKQLIDAQNAIVPMKACKNKAEMEGMKLAHVYDGVAMAHFIAWVENEIVKEKRQISEVEIDEVLTGYRAQQPGFVEVSFPTIAGVGSNGAIIHYSAKKGSELLKYLDDTNPILIDSGGQYECGTTDVTRTWHFGEATEEFKEYYTRVLKGNIGVDAMIWPENTPGFVLDVFARKALWEIGKDYGHGTGHGVGAALNVHEGPQSISPRFANKEPLKKGMVVSNEPGYYEDGKCGIRIENLLEVTFTSQEENDAYDKKLSEEEEDGAKKEESTEKKFLKFEKLTMIPIQKNLINLDIMTDDELDWLDTYHAEVFEKVSPLMEEGSAGLAWLTKACEKIDRKDS